MQLKDNDVLLAVGYDSEDVIRIRWLFKFVKISEQGLPILRKVRRADF